MSAGTVSVRPAQATDTERIHGWIVDLAEYQGLPGRVVVGTAEMLHRALFGDPPRAEALIAEHDGRPVGFALFFATFSTWECRQGIWLEDLYVEEAARGSGAGRALLARLAELTIERGGARLEWFSDETNLPALAFYEHLGAERRSRSELHRLDGEALRRVAGLT